MLPLLLPSTQIFVGRWRGDEDCSPYCNNFITLCAVCLFRLKFTPFSEIPFSFKGPRAPSGGWGYSVLSRAKAPVCTVLAVWQDVWSSSIAALDWLRAQPQGRTLPSICAMQIRTEIFLWRNPTCFVILLRSEGMGLTITCIILEESPLPG